MATIISKAAAALTRVNLSTLTVILLGILLYSCSNADDAEMLSPYSSEGNVSEACVTFTYTVPEDIMRYAEITVARNNNEGTDAQWRPMLEPTHTETYNISKFPVTAPVVMIYEFTNRPAYGISGEWDITMDIQAVLTIDGRKEVRNHNETYHISGDLGAGLEALMKNVLDRTYAVKIDRHGNIQFVH